MRMDNVFVMEEFQATLTGLWREACRHIEISESAATIAKLLGEHMPIGQLLVRRVDSHRSCVETAAVGFAAPDYLLPDARSQCSAAKIEEVSRWCRRDRLPTAACLVGQTSPWRFLCPPAFAATF